MLTVEVVSPETVSYTGEAEMVIARTVGGGDIAFQPGHVSFIGNLAVWSVDVLKPGGDRDTFAVHRGFVQVSGDTVTILSDVSADQPFYCPNLYSLSVPLGDAVRLLRPRASTARGRLYGMRAAAGRSSVSCVSRSSTYSLPTYSRLS